MTTTLGTAPVRRTGDEGAAPPRRTSTNLLLGSLPDMRSDILALMTSIARQHGPVAEFRLGPKRAVLVSGPEEMRQVLVSRATDYDKGPVQRRALTPVLRGGLLIAEGAAHQRQRRLIAPYFSSRRVAHWVDLFATEAERHANALNDGQAVELLQVMGAITRDVIRKLLWSVPIDGEDDLAEAVTRVFEWEMRNLLSVLPAPTWLPTGRNRALYRDLAFVRTAITGIIEERRSRPEAYPDILGALLQARYDDGSPMSDAQLLDELVTLWGAAYETSADAQFWTAYALATHPEIRDRVEEEVDRVLGDRLPTAADLPQLAYCLQVFRESLRLYPPAASMMRAAVRDTELSGYRIRRGTTVFLSTFAMHRDPELFPNPSQFDPDRFDADQDGIRHRFAYLPFGAGRHVCIGSQLALTEGQVFTAVLARRLRFEFGGDPVEPQLLINLRPRGHVNAVVRRRTHSDRTPIPGGDT